MSDWNSFFSKLLSGDYEIGGSFNCNIFNDSSYFMETFHYSHSNYSKWENERKKILKKSRSHTFKRNACNSNI